MVERVQQRPHLHRTTGGAKSKGLLPNNCYVQLSKRPLENFARCKFDYSPSDRGYLQADIDPDPGSTKQPIRVATTQLECPFPPASMYYKERRAQVPDDPC